jgi:hypothetical protein
MWVLISKIRIQTPLKSKKERILGIHIVKYPTEPNGMRENNDQDDM